MPSTKRPPGENIRNLGYKRHHSALLHYALAVAILIGTALVLITNITFSLGLFLSLGGLASSYYLYRSGRHLTKRAGDAQRGAKAEKEVAVLLSPLQRQGWQIEYNLRIRRWGDADLVLHSPKGNWYVIDVKSHGGTKIYESGRLRKRYGRNIYDFKEGDLIGKVKGQANEVKSLKGARWVTAMLCFTKGDIDISRHEITGVYIVNTTNLLSILSQLER